MALVSFPTTHGAYNIGGPSRSFPITSHAITTLNNSLSQSNSRNKGYVLRCYHSPFQHQPLNDHTIFSPKRTGGLSLVPFKANNSSQPGGEEDSRALETVLKFYNAIKKKNVRELSDVIGDECQCVSNFFSSFQSVKGKRQVLDFFLHLIRSLGNNIEFVVTPTIHDGMSVGIKWRLECEKTHVPLGKGFSFHVCHVYHGKVAISNVEMFLEPLLHIEPLRLRIIRYVTAITNKISSYPIFRDKRKRPTYILLTLLIIVAMILLYLFTRP